MDAITLLDIRDCLDGGFPAVIATCAVDGTPNVSVISDARYIDESHIALSFQFFNKTRANILANPNASLQVTDPASGTRYHLTLRYLRTETSGPLFEAMKARLAGIASHVGMSKVFRLRGSDVYEVLGLRCIVGKPARHSRAALLTVLRQYLPELRRCRDLAALLDVTLSAVNALGFQHCMLLSADVPGQRLFTIASTGYPETGVGSEIGLGEGVIGVAARERAPIRITHMASDYLYGEIVREQFMAANAELDLEREIPLPGLPESRSQLALPLVSAGDLLGVLYIESPLDGSITPTDEDACAALADQFADLYVALNCEEAMAGDEPSVAAAPLQEAGVPLIVSHDPLDHSVFVDNEYLIKGVAGAILWRILGDYVGSARAVFTNRDLRRDQRLGLPEISDNLEARLVLLQRRLAERRPEFSLQKIGRGRYQLRLSRPVELASDKESLRA